jgi:transposase-like protein
MEKKLTALTLYASGLSINKIAGLLKVSPPAVLRWIRKLGSSLCPKPQPSEVKSW